MEKKLVRSKKERMLLGVLGGISEYLNVDPALVRLVFIVLLVFNPFTMTLLYFLAALVIPEEDENYEKPLKEKLREVVDETEEQLNDVFSDGKTTRTLAVVILLLGILLLVPSLYPLLRPLPVFPLDFRTLIAVILLFVGIILLVRGD